MHSSYLFTYRGIFFSLQSEINQQQWQDPWPCQLEFVWWQFPRRLGVPQKGNCNSWLFLANRIFLLSLHCWKIGFVRPVHVLKIIYTFMQGAYIGGPERAIILWKPNKSLFEGSPSVGIHGQKKRFLDFDTIFNLVYWSNHFI